MNCTRPNITYVVSKLSRYTHNPCFRQWIALIRILKYLRGTTDLGLHFSRNLFVLEGYSDAS